MSETGREEILPDCERKETDYLVVVSDEHYSLDSAESIK